MTRRIFKRLLNALASINNTFQQSSLKGKFMIYGIKFFILATLMSVGIASASPHSGLIEIAPEVSAVLVSSEYASAMKRISQKDQVQIQSIELTSMGQSTFVSITLTSRGRDYGSIVSFIVYGKGKQPTIDGLYFKPAAGGPGGVSVGNN